MADRLEVRLHGEQIGWITRGSRRERIEFEWADGYAPGPVTLTELFGSVLLKAPSPAASSFFGGYALEGRQRERLTQRRGISSPADLYAMLREFGNSIAGAVTVSDPDTASQTQPRTSRSVTARSSSASSGPRNNGDLGSDDQSRSILTGLRPKLLLAPFDGHFVPLPHGRSSHYLPHPGAERLPGRPNRLRQGAPRALAPQPPELRAPQPAAPNSVSNERPAGTPASSRRYNQVVDGRTDRASLHQKNAAKALRPQLGGWAHEGAGPQCAA